MSLQNFETKVSSLWTKEHTEKVTAGKNLLILPTTAPLLLRELGILNADASMSASSVKKFLQINHLLACLEPVFKDLAKRFSPIRVVEFGSGKSYLSFLLAACAEKAWQANIRILGIDRQPQLVERCEKIAASTGLSHLTRFAALSIADTVWPTVWQKAFPEDSAPDEKSRPNALLALHACDTATCEAIGFGLALKSDAICVAPCCQAELSQSWSAKARSFSEPSEPMAPIWHSPHFRREIAAHTTDMFRTLLLRGCGYETTALEFTDSEHTPKNVLLRALRKGDFHKPALAEYAALKSHFGHMAIRLETLLPGAQKNWLAHRNAPPV